MSEVRSSGPEGTNGGRNTHGPSEVDQNTWWAWPLGRSRGVWGGLLREQKGRLTAQPQLDDVLHADSLQSSPG